MRFLALFFTLLFSSTLYAQGSVAVLMYHNVSDSTPRSTSVTLEELKAHVEWLQAHNFQILSLEQALDGIKKQAFSDEDYIAAITFDDGNRSVCETAWPYLKKQNIPFTVFINSEPVEKRFASQCTLEQLKELAQSKLVTLANHGKQHIHMSNRFDYESDELWQSAYIEEIKAGESFLKDKLDVAPRFFAYPYGEFNQAIKDYLKEQGYTAFGQHSGAIGKNSDPLILPRFAAAGQYANLDTLSVKLKSLAFPASIASVTDSPIVFDSQDNPPQLRLQLSKTPYGQVNCFLANGKPISVSKNGNELLISADEKLGKGRQRYNCTASSGKNGRFYWLSHQWVIY